MVNISNPFEEHILPTIDMGWDTLADLPNALSNGSELDSFLNHLTTSDGNFELNTDTWSSSPQPTDSLSLQQPQPQDVGLGQWPSEDISGPAGTTTAAGHFPDTQIKMQTLRSVNYLNHPEENAVSSALPNNDSNKAFISPFRVAHPNPPKLTESTLFGLHRRPDSPKYPSSPKHASTSSYTLGSSSDGSNTKLEYFISLLRKLSATDIELLQHKHTMPPVPKSGSSGSSSQSSPDISPPSERASGRGFGIDTTFRLTQNLIGIFSDISNLLPGIGSLNSPRDRAGSVSKPQSRGNRISSVTGLYKDHDLLNEYDHSDEKAVGDSIAKILDQGSIMLMLSTYVRVIDIYEDMFGHVQSQRQQPPETSPCAIPLPSIKIGTFSALDATLHMSMVIQFSVQVLASLRRVVGRLSSQLDVMRSRGGLGIGNSAGDGLGDNGEGGSNSGGFFGHSAHTSDVVAMTCKAVRLREKELIRTATQILQPLLHLDIT